MRNDDNKHMTDFYGLMRLSLESGGSQKHGIENRTETRGSQFLLPGTVTVETENFFIDN
jgi:hypothetical protein